MYTIIHFNIGVDANDIQKMVQKFIHSVGQCLCYDEVRRRFAVRVDDRSAFSKWSVQYKSVIIRIESVNTPYVLSSIQWQADNQVEYPLFSPLNCCLIAGPCSIESHSQLVECATFLSQRGIKMMRAGAIKGRTSPFQYRGMGLSGYDMMQDICSEYGLMSVCEVFDEVGAAYASKRIDWLQVGARSMQNYTLLTALSKLPNTVILKRGLSNTYKEWLQAADYLLSSGKKNVVLMERGIRSFETQTRFTFDIAAIPVMKQLSHLPVFADPSHAAGDRTVVIPIAKGALAAGAQGLMIEIHPKPSEARCDGSQALTFPMFDGLINKKHTFIN
ncbi:3-deoxy-7-phosphoheptulonate synthase [Chlamydiia bacterium]|nr:3-deoxy-7-phosphoheptulonate synthase [Chlamydiia bacterium]